MILLCILLLSAWVEALIRLHIVQKDVSLIDQSKKKRDLIPTVPIFNANAREYFVHLGIGTPIQLFNVTLDTGSSDIWIPSSQCNQGTCPPTRFKESKSSTLNQTKRIFEVHYGSGSAKGITAYDTVTLGGLSCPQQLLGLASSTSGVSNGILGLGFASLMTTGNEPFISHLVKLNIIHEPVFSIYLNRKDNGEIVLGGYDTNRFTGQLSFLPVLQYDNNVVLTGKSYKSSNTAVFKYWSVPFQSVSLLKPCGTEIYRSSLSELQPAILDTGTTLSYFPPEVVLSALKSITKDYKPLLSEGKIQAYQVQCSHFFNTSLWFSFGFSASPKDFSNLPVEIHVPLEEMVLPQGNSQCLFGMAPSNSHLIVGQTILRSAYVVHDMLGLQVGIGDANHVSNQLFNEATRTGRANKLWIFLVILNYIVQLF